MRLLWPAVVLLGASPAPWGDIIITTADDVRRARSIEIRESSGHLKVEYVDLNGRTQSIRASDVVEIGFPSPAPPSRAPRTGEVELVTTAGDTLLGTMGPSEEGRIAIAGGSLGPASYPLERIDQIRILANRPTWPRRAPSRRDGDAVITTTGDQRTGSLRSAASDGIVLRSLRLDRDVRIGLDGVSAVFLMSSGTPPAPPTGLYSIAILSDGSTLQGMIDSLRRGALTLADLYGEKRTVDAASVAALYFRNGRVVYLSDVPVAKADENPNYIRLADPLPSDLSFPHRRDRNAKDQPLRIRVQTFRKGVGVHAFSSLTWTLDGRYSRFQATIGIDDAASESSGGEAVGNVTFRVYADGTLLFDSGPVTSKDAPRPVSVAIQGRRELTLVADFGEDRSGQGDLADWAQARVIQ